MRTIPAMVDLKRSPAEKAEDAPQPAAYEAPDYPWGLRISLSEAELEKLGLDDEVEVGDMIHMHAMGTVTAISKQDVNGQKSCRVEIQITHMVSEDEAEEDEEAEDRSITGRLYTAAE